MSGENRAKGGLSFETVGSIAAIVIGACALFVAWDQAQIMRKQQHASVLPVLNVTAGFRSDASRHIVTVSIRNGGIGPAVIQSSSMVIAGEPIKDWKDFSERFLPAGLRTDFETSLDSTGGILAAGETNEAIEIVWPRNERTDAAVQELRARVFASESDQIDFGLCYCSVFDRCWRTNAQDSARPVPVSKCDDAGEDVVARLLQTLPNGETL